MGDVISTKRWYHEKPEKMNQIESFGMGCPQETGLFRKQNWLKLFIIKWQHTMLYSRLYESTHDIIGYVGRPDE